jgi:hypothetical protein
MKERAIAIGLKDRLGLSLDDPVSDEDSLNIPPLLFRFVSSRRGDRNSKISLTKAFGFSKSA